MTHYVSLMKKKWNLALLHGRRCFSVSAAQDMTIDFPAWAFDSRSFFRFEITHKSTKSMARAGLIHTPHGIIETPTYVPVATNASLKGVDFRSADAQLIFCNTYHLLLQPGREVVRDAGGIHKFTGRNRPFITDSGGFQVFSLANDLSFGERRDTDKSQTSELKRNTAKLFSKKLDNDAVEITEDGVKFKSYHDGSSVFVSPENVVDAQKDIGADIIIPLDELPTHGITRDALSESLERSHRWETRSLKRHLENVKNQAMYAVIHGGLDVELRTKSIEYLTSLPFDGYAVGGSLGKSRNDLYKLLDWMMPLFEQNGRDMKPRHLLGIADEESIRNAIPKGFDTLDSCYPTKLGRRGTLLTEDGLLRIKRGRFKTQHGIPIDRDCTCSTCQTYDRAYLNHLFTTDGNEYVAVMLGTQHNLHFMDTLMKQFRNDILNDKI